MVCLHHGSASDELVNVGPKLNRVLLCQCQQTWNMARTLAVCMFVVKRNSESLC
jgi:hypothetical protein